MSESLVLTVEGARAALAAAVAQVRAEGSTAAVAVVDAGGHLLVLERMDGAGFHTVHSATTKATCAASMRKPTGLGPDSPIDMTYGFGIAMAAGPERWTPLPGGEPIVVDGVCVGAVGVAGAPHQVDVSASRAGAAALA